MRVVFHRLAARDYDKAHRWYARLSTDLANRFRLSILAAVNRIESAPKSFGKVYDDFRAAPVRRFPYRLWYQQRGPDFIMIVAVAHTSRRQQYWRCRKT